MAPTAPWSPTKTSLCLIEDHTHLIPLGREAAWNLAAKVSAAFAQGRELNLAHWDFEPIEWQRRG